MYGGGRWTSEFEPSLVYRVSCKTSGLHRENLSCLKSFRFVNFVLWEMCELIGLCLIYVFVNLHILAIGEYRKVYITQMAENIRI